MANGFRRSVTTDKQTVASGGVVACTLAYVYVPIVNGESAPRVSVTANPGFRISWTPNPLELAAGNEGSFTADVTVEREDDAPVTCSVTFHGLDDIRVGSFEVTP